jgi:hypothetical protein
MQVSVGRKLRGDSESSIVENVQKGNDIKLSLAGRPNTSFIGANDIIA